MPQPNTPQRKNLMFKLRRYFLLTSLIAFVIITLLLGVFYRQLALRDLLELQESKNAALTQAFANSLWPQFAPFVEAATTFTPEELQVQPEIPILRQAVIEQMTGLSVVKVKVYNLDGLTVFSTETAQIGEDKSSNAGYLAARSGQIASELTHRDTFSAFEETIEDRDVFSSYVPIRQNGAAGEVEGVLELYDDVTPFIQRLEDTQKNVVGGVILLLLLLYLVLYLVIRRADTIIHDQYNQLIETGHVLHEQKEHLEELVLARTAELTGSNSQLREEIVERKRAEEALITARDQALQASRVKSEILARVSHELRTPLGIILGISEMLETEIYGSVNDHQLKATKRIIHQTHTLTNLVEELLVQAQLEVDKLLLQEAYFKPQDLLASVEATIEPYATAKGLALITEIAPDLPAVLWGDQQRIQQILVNLLGNAIKFTPQGQVSLFLGGADANHWVMRVSDTGIGIPAEAQTTIFEAFRQVDGSTTRRHGGFGLGLSIVHGLTTAMGGQVHLHSSLEGGSTFTVLLPLPQTNEAGRTSLSR